MTFVRNGNHHPRGGGECRERISTGFRRIRAGAVVRSAWVTNPNYATSRSGSGSNQNHPGEAHGSAPPSPPKQSSSR